MAACTTDTPAGTTLTAVPRPTVTVGPEPTLPLARAVTPVPSPEAGAVAASGGQTMVLHSAAFVAGGLLPAAYTCDGSAGSPPLEWMGVPASARAFALIEQDADTTSGGQSFTHWLLYNLPAGITRLDAGVPPRALLVNGGQQGVNGQHTIGYAAACPTKGDPPHHFSFELYALDGYLTLETGASTDEVRAALPAHTVGQATLALTVQR
ncbi:MAG TPA: YbhB/YbcL family Raf kinase inhibitor-like protein [Chloroflexota bacterium]